MNSMSQELADQLRQAMTWHQQGKLQDALTLYRRIVELDPNNFPAVYSMGMLLGQAKRLNEALDCFTKATKLQPNDFSAHFYRAMALEQSGHYDEALASYRMVVNLKPDLVNAYVNIGNILKNLQRPEEALTNYNKALALKPDFIEVYNNRGNVLMDLQRYEDALGSYQKAIDLRPDFALAYSNIGNLFNQLGRYSEALTKYEEAIALNPQDADTWNNRGLLLQDRFKRYQEALASFDKVIEIAPDFAEGHYNRGVLFSRMKRYEDAIESYEKAIALRPNYAIAYNNRANALRELRRYDEALSNFNTAITLNPQLAEAYYSRGVLLTDLTKFDEAMTDYETAIAITPDYPEANYNMSFLKLLTGNFEEGWTLYEWRWRTEHAEVNYEDYKRGLWLGEQPIAGKIILIRTEQGLGDFIHFVRYVPLVEAQGAKVILETPAALVPLMRTLNGTFTIVTKGDVLPNFDLRCPIMSLPLVFKTTLETIPATIPYLKADSGRQLIWRERLGPKSKPRIGLVWSGNPQHKNDHNRSIPLRLLKPLFELDVEFHSLQVEVRSEDQASLAELPIHTHSEALHDFADTAALVSELDAVIAVDTSVTHLAGALGKPIWILLPCVPDFRWLLGRNDSPWYPTARLFRQTALGDWEGVIQNVVAELRLQFKV